MVVSFQHTYQTILGWNYDLDLLIAELRVAIENCKDAREESSQLRKWMQQESLPYSPGNMAALAAIFGTDFIFEAGGALGAARLEYSYMEGEVVGSRDFRWGFGDHF